MDKVGEGYRSLEDLKQAEKGVKLYMQAKDPSLRRGLDRVVVRKEGGCDVVLTSKSQEELKSNICNIKEWFKEWIQFVVEWKPGFHLEQERCLWLRCYGIPLNLWNMNTHNTIGSIWGVLNLDGDICQPKSFSYIRIKVVTTYHLVDFSSMKHNGMEDCSSNEIYCSEEEGNFLEECCWEKEDDDEVAEMCDCHMHGAELACTNEVKQRKEPIYCHIREDVNTVVEETKWDGGCSRDKGTCIEEIIMEKTVHRPKSNDDNQRYVKQVITLGFIRSFSGPSDGLRPGINLKVDLAQSTSKNFATGPSNRPNEPTDIRPDNNGILALCCSHMHCPKPLFN
ncbi:hypothetical protein ACSBR1_040352 [Camellia fascicularis]